MLICAAFKSHMEWSNAQHVSTPTTMILTTIMATYHSLNCFGHVVYTLQTSLYQNMAKLLIRSSNFLAKTTIIISLKQPIQPVEVKCSYPLKTLQETNPVYGIYVIVGWLFGFYGISTFVGYLMPNPFLYK